MDLTRISGPVSPLFTWAITQLRFSFVNMSAMPEYHH